MREIRLGRKYAYYSVKQKITLEFTDRKTCLNFLKGEEKKKNAESYISLKNMKCNFTGQRLPVPHHNFIASLFKGAGLVSIRDAQLFILQVMKTFYQPVSTLRAAIGLYKKNAQKEH